MALASSRSTDHQGSPNSSVQPASGALPAHATVLDKRFGELALRMFIISAALVLGQLQGTGFIILIVLVGIAIDVRNPLSLKNFFLVYTFLLFGVGAGVMHLTTVPVLGDAASFTLVFLVGYGLANFPGLAPSRRTGGNARVVDPSTPSDPLSIPSIERAIYVLGILELLLLAYQFYRYGVVGYFKGRQLVDTFYTYGKADSAGGAEQIVRFGLTYSSVAIVILYVRACFDSPTPIRYRYPVGLLAITPLLLLHRFDAVLGAASTLAIYACERRFHKPHCSTPVRSTQHVSGTGRRNRRGRILVVVAVIVVFCGAIVIGGLRKGLGPTIGGSKPSIPTHTLLTEEFYPVQGYADIRANSNLLGHPYGKTIILPLLFKIVPRAWYPNKPLNSSSYYMSKVHPDIYAAGFGVPPTFYGDSLLSFGYVGALIACLVLGCISARVDLGYKYVSRASGTTIFLIVFTNYYALMRGAISETVAGVLLTLLVFALANKLMRNAPGTPPKAVNEGLRRPASGSTS